MPKIETQGQLGKARWRLVSAPSIPGLLSLDPETDPFRGLASLTLGTEVEVQFGRSVQVGEAAHPIPTPQVACTCFACRSAAQGRFLQGFSPFFSPGRGKGFGGSD